MFCDVVFSHTGFAGTTTITTHYIGKLLKATYHTAIMGEDCSCIQNVNQYTQPHIHLYSTVTRTFSLSDNSTHDSCPSYLNYDSDALH